jgi:hypothetical protein
MLAYLLHLLQPLNVACFALLKRRYSNVILGLARNCTSYISKETFLPAFKTTFKQSIIKENIRAGFRGASLVLHNLQAVLSKLNIVV